jgi:hypothetical protein
LVTVAPASAADTATAVFNTAGAYGFTVPAGVTSVTITAIAAAGGSTPFVNSSFDCEPGGGAGGHGASVTGSFTVSGGEALQIGVGAPGQSVSQCTTGQPGDGGYGGGGAGGPSGGNIGGAAGGGGASEVAVAAPSPAFYSPLIVAAGGGGAGGFSFLNSGPTNNGGAGGSAGAGGGAVGDANGGGAGTSSAGGSGGADPTDCSGEPDGAPGLAGFGGEGAEAGGGGGGGGYYGGGGGEGGCVYGGGGGGGGSSFVASGTLNAVPVASPAGVVITYGVPAVSLSGGGGGTGSGPYGFVFPTAQPEDTAGAAEVFPLTNNGSAPLVVSGIVLSGADPSDYIVSNGCQQPVAVSSSCDVEVRFAPQATGASSATMTISSNAINGSEVISLSGTGGALPQGAPGKIELVTCKAVTKKVHRKKVTKEHCTTKLTSSPKKFTTSSAHADLMRADRVYATGWLRHGKLVLHTDGALRPGRFRLTLTYQSAGRVRTESETVTIR